MQTKVLRLHDHTLSHLEDEAVLLPENENSWILSTLCISNNLTFSMDLKKKGLLLLQTQFGSRKMHHASTGKLSCVCNCLFVFLKISNKV